mgnify:CR=1 FL=1
MAPLVGRDQELGLLLERLRQARSGEGQVVLLSGEAGIGKSRITEALVEAAARPVDMTVAAIVGCAGLAPVMAAVERGGTIALANKEALVSAGEVLMEAAGDPAARDALNVFFRTTRFLPVDPASQQALDDLRRGVIRVREQVE